MPFLSIRPRGIIFLGALVLLCLLALSAWHRDPLYQAFQEYSDHKESLPVEPSEPVPITSLADLPIDTEAASTSSNQFDEILVIDEDGKPGWDVEETGQGTTTMTSTETEDIFESIYFDAAPLDHPSMHRQMTSMKEDNFDLSKLATLVETRDSKQLLPVIENYLEFLPKEWPMRIYHSETNRQTLQDGLLTHIAFGRVTLVMINNTAAGLPSDLKIDAAHAIQEDQAHHVSDFLKLPEFWDNQSPAEHILMFQIDSVLCSTSRFTANDFLDFDFIGAPITWPAFELDPARQLMNWVNGGLSLRSRSWMLKILRDFGDEVTEVPEDLWFYQKLEAAGAALPTHEQANKFAVQMYPNEAPFGVHQYYNWMQEENKAGVLGACPEVVLIQPIPEESSAQEVERVPTGRIDGESWQT